VDAVGKLADMRRRKTAPYLLELDLTRPLFEERPTDPLRRLQWRRRAVLSGVLKALKDAAVDPRVCGLVAKVEARRMGFAQAQELRAAVATFRPQVSQPSPGARPLASSRPPPCLITRHAPSTTYGFSPRGSSA